MMIRSRSDLRAWSRWATAHTVTAALLAALAATPSACARGDGAARRPDTVTLVDTVLRTDTVPVDTPRSKAHRSKKPAARP